MVAIVAGPGLGLDRSSASILGLNGQLGNSSFGRFGENVSVNAVNGNLIINRTDEVLIGQGPDDVLIRSYNSLGPSNDDNGDNWQFNAQRRVVGLTGTLNTAGSTVTRIDWDGSDTLFTFDINSGAYISTQGSGAYDKLTFASNTWTWADGSTGLVELYDNQNGGRIISSTDLDGNQLNYSYTGSLLTRVSDASGESTTLTWSGSNVTQITSTTSGGVTATNVRYSYDSQNRLSTVTTDLSPSDNSIADGAATVTTYTYDGTSKRVASISQTGGARLDITYTAQNRVATLVESISGTLSRTTTLSYDPANNVTSVTDTQGQVTKLTFDANGQLTRIDLPPAQSGAVGTFVTYAYNSNGDVTSFTDAVGNTTTYLYDGHGNLVQSQDQAGNRIVRTYDSDNELLTETHFRVPANQIPLAANDSITTTQGTAATFDPKINDGDPNGDPFTIVAITQPGHGSAILNADNTVTYTPAAAYAGPDSLTYTLTDGQGHFATGTISLTVVNRPPVAANDSVTTSANVAVSFNPRLNDSDPEGDALTLVSAGSPQHGTAVVNADGTLTYTPANNYIGPDSFTYTISDGRGNNASATVSVTVTNHIPVAANDAVSVSQGTAITFDPRANDSDADSDPLTIIATSAPSHGGVVINGSGTLTYTPVANYHGSDSFTYTISDGHGHTATATVSVTVVNRPPAVANRR